jgi:hypothetical protein
MPWTPHRPFGVLCALIVASLLCASPVAAQTRPGELAPVTRLVLRVSGGPSGATVRGVLAAVDARGQAVSDIAERGLQATVDGQAVNLQLAAERPSIALAVGLLLDSSANATVRTTLAAAIASGLQDMDTRRDAVAIVSTAERRGWDQATFTISADDLRRSLESLVQKQPIDDLLSLGQVAELERALAAQAQDLKVLLLVTNRAPASAATPATNMALLRAMAIDDHLQISVLVLPQAGGQGVAEALAEATPGGGVEYVLNATNQADLTLRVSSLLAPAVGARGFSLPVLSEGSHTLSLTAPGLATRTQATFTVAGRAIGIAAIETNGAAVTPGRHLDRPTWLTARTAAEGPIEGVEWSVDGRLSQASVDPFALLVDPNQTGDGNHAITARAIFQGRAGPLATTSVYVPFDAARVVRQWLRDWGLLIAVLLANGLIAFALVRRLAGRGDEAAFYTPRNDFPPILRLKQRADAYIAPEVIDFLAAGKLRIGYHPPFMDNHVGTPQFERLPFQDIRGDDELVKDLSRHAACIWREPQTNDCFIQLGWPAPGEPVHPKPQAQVLHFGKPQDATSKAYRLFHQDVIRLSSRVEYVFNQLALRDKPTPERTKVDAFTSDEPDSSLSARITQLATRFHDSEAEPGAREEPDR